LLDSADAIEKFISADGTQVIAYVKEGSDNYNTWVQTAKSEKFTDFVAGHVFDAALWGSNKEGAVVMYKPNEDSLTYGGDFSDSELLKWLFAEGYPLYEELAQAIWVRASKSGTPLLAVFDKSEDGVQELLTSVAKKFKGEALFSVSNRDQLLAQWGGSGQVFPSAIMVIWKGQDPKMKVWDEENGVAFDEAGLTDFVKQTLAGTYQSFKKSEPIPAENNGPVITLVGKNFDEIVYNSNNKPVFVEFYAPWCGHCKSLAPVWEKLGTALADSNVIIAKMDATANHLSEDIPVKGFPTLILFKGKEQIPFDGNRELEGLTEFVKLQISGEGEGEEKEDL